MASKIGKAEWYAVYAAALTVDVIQWVADFIIGPGEAANEIANPIIGAVAVAYFELRGVKIAKNWKRLGSLIGGTVAEMLTVSVLPAWILDVIFIHSDVKKEEEAERALKEQQDLVKNNINQPRYENGMRTANQGSNGAQMMAGTGGGNKGKPPMPLYGGSGQVGIGKPRGK